MAKNKTIIVNGTEIVLYSENQEDYISLTDIARYRDTERSDYILQNWMRNRSTIEFMGLWEQFHNPDLTPSNSMELKIWQVQIAFLLLPNDGLNQQMPKELFQELEDMVEHTLIKISLLNLLPG